MPESHTPNRISQPHTLTSCEPSFASGALSPLLSAVFCAIIIYIAVVYYILLYILYAII